MEGKERYEIHIYDDICVDLYDNGVLDKSINDTYKLEELLNQQDKRIKELEEELDDAKRDYIPKLEFGLQRANKMCRDAEKENQQLKDQVKKSYQEGLLQKQFDKDMEIQELKDKIETLKQSQKQLAIEELKLVLENFRNRPTYFDASRQELCLSDQDKQFIDFIDNQIKSLKGE